MINPGNFYYSEAQELDGFGRNPPGQLSVPRLITNKPCWRQSIQQQAQIPKTLILDDWTATTWSWKKFDAVNRMIKNYIDDGFTLYAWSDGTLVKLGPRGLGLVDRDRMTPATVAEITAVAAKYHLSADKIHVLDDYGLESILEGDFGWESVKGPDNKRAIVLSDVLFSSHNKTKLLSWLKQAVPRSTIVANALDLASSINLYLDCYSSINERMPIQGRSNAVIFKDLLEQELHSDVAIALQTFVSTKMSLFHKYSAMISAVSHDLLRSFELFEDGTNGLFDEEVIQFLQNNPILQTLKLRKFNLSKALLNTLSILQELETFDFSSSDVSFSNLIVLVENVPRLRSLKLTTCKFIKNADLTVLGDLEHLESLDLTGSDIDTETLVAILRKTPNLRELILTDCENIEIEKINVSLQCLERLNSEDTCLDIQSSIISNALILQGLNLNLYRNTLNVVMNSATLDQLDSISLQGSEAADIACLRQKAANIRTLAFDNLLSEDKPATQAALNEIAQFECLESLTLTHCIGSPELLKPLLEASRLKTLEFKNCIFFNHPSYFHQHYFDQSPFEQIETLIMTSIPYFEISQTFPNLHTLKLQLDKWKLVDKLILFNGPVNTTIRHLDLPSDLKDIPVDALRNLLNWLPNLQEPSLSIISEHIAQLEQKPPEKQASMLEPVVAHDPHQHMNSKPTNTKELFVFKGTDKTKSQNMVIEKLSQYLTLTQTHTAMIPYIQDGICNGLAHWFLSQDDETAEQKLNAICAWDGKTAITEPLPAIFEELVYYIKEHQLNCKKQSPHYVGDALREVIPSLTSPCILENPWHAIALKPIRGENSACLYDPNDPRGPIRVANDQLCDAIQHHIGTLVSITSETACHILPNIDDIHMFFQQGGLIALDRYENLEHSLLLESPIEKAALDGLLLRDVEGMPAWMIGIHNPSMTLLTLGLLAQFINHDPHATERLEKSIETLTPYQRYELIVALHQPLDDGPSTQSDLISQLSDVVRRAPANLDYYRAQLKTWIQEKPFAHSINAYCQCLVKPVGANSKRLIELPSSAGIDAMQLALQQYCLSTSRQVFYVNTPDDLLCQSTYIARDDQGIGRITPWHEGPGSPLLQFIRAHQNTTPAPVLIINYDHFKPSDIVSFNALLDNPRKADGIELPENMLIVGLMNPHSPHSYRGADFYSRMGQIEQCPFSDEELARTIKPLPQMSIPENTRTYTIHLNRSLDWQERLLGRWMIHDDVYTFKDGELTKAIESGLPIVIENGLWEHPEFRQFWQQAILHKKIVHSGGKISLPDPFHFDTRSGYDWLSLSQGLQVKQGVNPGAEAINPTRLNRCFNQLTCDNTRHTANEKIGLLEAHAHQSLALTMTQALSEGEWAMLLRESTLHHVNLTCHLASGVTLPADLSAHIAIENTPTAIEHHSHTQLIQSSDPDVTIAQLTKDRADWRVIDVTDCSAYDLLQQIHAEFDEKQSRFYFTETEGALLTALGEHQNIILTGTFSPELVDELAPILLKRQTTSMASSQLILVSDRLQAFNYASVETREISVQEKKECLTCDYSPSSIEEVMAHHSTESMVRLKARLDYQQQNPNDNTDNAWQGIAHLDINLSNQPWDAKTSQAETLAFNQYRLKLVNERLKESPFVFLTGLTAVGKSTFVERYLSAEHGDALFNNISQARDWALSTGNSRPILFIDEANMTSKQWREFEGLFNKPPGIVIDGTYYPLSPEHKVVFAGNPLNYGDRKLPSFFERHGNALVFDPLPNAFIYEEIIKPVFQSTPLEALSEAIAPEILEVYQFLCKHAKHEILISPRELQMMALLVASYMKQYPNEDPIRVAHHYRYQLAQSLIPQAQRAEFEKEFAPAATLLRQTMPSAQQNFTLTPSSEAVKNQLVDWLSLSIAKRNTQPDAPNAKRYGGLGGLIIEGYPGIGKSELVRTTLYELGFIEQKLDQPDTVSTPSDKTYYDIQANMPLDEKKRILRRAFHEGAVVLIDEMNSSALMEDLMNDLLMGKTSEKERPQKPGFMIIGTQNPSTMAGRKNIGNALSRRLMTVKLPNYSDSELRAILNNAGVPTEKTEQLVNAYLEAFNYAEKNHLSPPPTFRDLWKLAKAELKMLGSIHNSTEETSQQNASHQVGLTASQAQQIMVKYKALKSDQSELDEDDKKNQFNTW